MNIPRVKIEAIFVELPGRQISQHSQGRLVVDVKRLLQDWLLEVSISVTVVVENQFSGAVAYDLSLNLNIACNLYFYN